VEKKIKIKTTGMDTELLRCSHVRAGLVWASTAVRARPYASRAYACCSMVSWLVALPIYFFFFNLFLLNFNY
jgi:hypothetical protein